MIKYYYEHSFGFNGNGGNIGFKKFNILFSWIPCDMDFQNNHSDSKYMTNNIMYVYHGRRKFESKQKQFI